MEAPRFRPLFFDGIWGSMPQRSPVGINGEFSFGVNLSPYKSIGNHHIFFAEKPKNIRKCYISNIHTYKTWIYNPTWKWARNVFSTYLTALSKMIITKSKWMILHFQWPIQIFPWTKSWIWIPFDQKQNLDGMNLRNLDGKVSQNWHLGKQ
jgi:hypothetical protein